MRRYSARLKGSLRVSNALFNNEDRSAASCCFSCRKEESPLFHRLAERLPMTHGRLLSPHIWMANFLALPEGRYYSSEIDRIGVITGMCQAKNLIVGRAWRDRSDIGAAWTRW